MSFLRSDPRNKFLRIIINGGLGDHLLIAPFIRHFKKSGLYEKVICVINDKAKELYDQNPYVDDLITCLGQDLYLWALPEQDYDIFSPYISVEEPDRVEDVHSLKAASLFDFNAGSAPVVQQLKAYYGISFSDESLEIFTIPDDEAWADETVKPWSHHKIVYLNAQSRLFQKNYPLALWQKTVNLLFEKNKTGLIVLQICEEQDKLDATQRLGFIPPLRRVTALLRRVSCIVTVDSFPGHLASAVGTPGIVLFGPSNPLVFGHRSNINIRTDICPPCADTRRRRECQRSICLEGISPESIVKNISALLERPAPR